MSKLLRPSFKSAGCNAPWFPRHDVLCGRRTTSGCSWMRHNWNWPGADRHLLSLTETVTLQLSPDPRQTFFVTVWDLLLVCPIQPQPASLALDVGLPSCQRLCVRLGIFCNDPPSPENTPRHSLTGLSPCPGQSPLWSNRTPNCRSTSPGTPLDPDRTPLNPYLER